MRAEGCEVLQRVFCSSIQAGRPCAASTSTAVVGDALRPGQHSGHGLLDVSAVESERGVGGHTYHAVLVDDRRQVGSGRRAGWARVAALLVVRAGDGRRCGTPGAHGPPEGDARLEVELVGDEPEAERRVIGADLVDQEAGGARVSPVARPGR